VLVLDHEPGEIVLVTSNISYGRVISGSQFVSRCYVICSVAMNENNRGKFATYLELSSRHLAISSQEITLNIK
jgi:hypothetical protein